MQYSRWSKNFPSPEKQRKGQHCCWLFGAKFHWTWQKFIFALVPTNILGPKANISIREFFTVVAQHQHKWKSISWRSALLLWFVRSPSTCKHVWIGMLIKISSNFIGQYKQEFQFLYFSPPIEFKLKSLFFLLSVSVERGHSGWWLNSWIQVVSLYFENVWKDLFFLLLSADFQNDSLPMMSQSACTILNRPGNDGYN